MRAGFPRIREGGRVPGVGLQSNAFSRTEQQRWEGVREAVQDAAPRGRPVGELSVAAVLRCKQQQQGKVPEMTLARGLRGLGTEGLLFAGRLHTNTCRPGIIPIGVQGRRRMGKETTNTRPRNSVPNAAASESGLGADRIDRQPAPYRCSSKRDPPRLDFTRKVRAWMCHWLTAHDRET